MNYKLYVSAYLEDSNQLLISFSSDDTLKEAVDYQSLAFDVVLYGDISANEIINEISKTAPTICSDIIAAESYTNNSEKNIELRNLVGQTFEYSLEDIEGIKTV